MRRVIVPLVGVLSLGLMAPPASARARCGAPGTRTRQSASLSKGQGETSGLVASSKYPGAGWMIRDSGHPASLYSLRFANGRPVVREVRVRGADNTDWEDITYSVGPDGRGRLWIVESMQTHRDPYIYEVAEPDPDHARSVPLLARHRYQYPGRGFQNTEAGFWYKGHLVLATKTSPTRLYRFDRLDGNATLRPSYVGALYGAPRISMVRAAPDHSALIVSDHETVSVFTGKGPGSELGDFVGKGPAYGRRAFRGDNVEAGDFFPTGSCNVVVLSESSHVYRLFGSKPKR